MEVNGKAKVFHNEKDGREWITISDSSKDINGNRVYQSYNARFKTGQPAHESFIEYEGFMTYWKKDDKTYTTIQVMNWDYVERTQAPNNTSVNYPIGSNVTTRQVEQQDLLRTDWKSDKVDKDTPLPVDEDLPF